MGQPGITAPPPPASEGRLESWKEIAAYLKKSVRTVQQWEKKEGLPVHRHQHDKLGTVYAYKPELDAWWRNGHERLEATEAEEAETTGTIGWRWSVAGAVAAAILVVAAVAWWWPRAPVLPFAERDWVLIAQFENQTGEEVFNGTLEHALERELSNSRFVNVVPRERVNDTLLLMRKPLDTPLTAGVGREVCLRDGAIRALLTGRVEKLDSTYLLSVAVVNPTSGVTVRSFSEEAAGQKEVVSALRSLSGQVRAALGEALPEIQKSEQALEKVTTPSLRALQLFSQADLVLSEPMPYGEVDDWARRRRAQAKLAEELLRQAVAEDPGFASAHMHLAWAMLREDRPEAEYRPHAERAVELSSKVSERERYFILGSYHGQKGESEKAVAQYQALLRAYPDHYWGVFNLKVEYRRLGRPEEALPYIVRHADLRPNDFFANATAMWELSQNSDDSVHIKRYHQRAQALITPETVQRFQAMSAVVETYPAYEHLQKGEMAEALDELTRLEKRIEEESNAYYFAEMGKAYLELGMLRKGEELFARIERKSDRYYFTSWADYLRRDWHALRQHRKLTAERTLYGPRDVDLFARAGLLAEGRRAIAEMEASKKPDAYIALARGYLAEAEGKTDEAVQLFEKARRDWKPTHRFRSAPIEPCAALARIQEQQGNLDRAIELLEWVRGQRARLGMGSTWMESQMQLAKLYRKVGRERDAQAIEDELRKLLIYADADHAIARELRQRQQAALTPPTQ